jgi:SNF2 family DNA or RNA helicase
MSKMLAVNVPYDPEFNQKIKTIPGRKFDWASKRWLIPEKYKAVVQRIVEGPGAVEAPREWRFQTAPRPYQAEAVTYAYAQRATLLDLFMGLGKSKVAIDTLVNRGHERILIVCPKSVVPVWEQQFARHGTPSYAVTKLDTGSVQRNLTLAKAAYNARWPSGQVLVVNYDALWRQPFGKWVEDKQWDCLIYDEIHALKSAGSKRSRFCYRLSLHATQILGLSGTPLPHSPADVYGVYRALDPTIFGTNFKKFQDEFCILGGYGGYEVLGWKNTAEFARRYDSIRFHVPRGVITLPETQRIDHPVALPKPARETYTKLAEDFYARVASGDVTIANALVRILRLQQVASGFVTDDEGSLQELHSGKAEALSDLLEGLAPDEPVVVFARFTRDLEMICRCATGSGRAYYEISGTAKDLDAWNAAAGGAVLGVQVGAGAEGIDLTKACYCIFYSLPLSLAQFDQAHARVHRPGQTRPVVYYYLLAQATVDRTIFRALQQRRDIIEAVVQGGDATP